MRSRELVKDYVLSIYADRFDKSVEKRNVMWQVLCRDYFQKLIRPSDTVLDLAAGYCEFINNINCGKKIAVDLNEKTKRMASKDVKVYQALSTNLPKQLSSKVDVVFVSNFFEHLDSKNELIDTLKEIHRVLKPGGKVMILQPNIRLVGNQYWDYVDHTLPLTEKSLEEAFHLTNFDLDYMKVRFLPYTANSKTPAIPLFIRMYLYFPPAQLLMGKQTFMIGSKPKSSKILP
jgi:ubiquinone/menaquinone biosynthesis C-methylase UbiE